MAVPGDPPAAARRRRRGPVGRIRRAVLGAVGRAGGLAALRTVRAILRVHDGVGGGLLAAGLAYEALLAFVPMLVLAVAITGLVAADPAARIRLVQLVGDALPPVAPVAEIALRQMAAGAVPTGIVAFAGLLWTSSRLHGSLDGAFALLIPGPRTRSEPVRVLRGLLVTGLVVALPALLLLASGVAAWLVDAAPDGLVRRGAGRAIWGAVAPAVVVAGHVVATAALYRFLPTRPVPREAWGVPALCAGVTIGVFTQLFGAIAPEVLGAAVLLGALATIFALLFWLSSALGVVLLGAAWTRVRLDRIDRREPHRPPPPGAGT